MKFPKNKPIRLTGLAMRSLRLRVYMRDLGKCVNCGVTVDFSGKDRRFPPMHLAHRRNKRMYGYTLDNVELMCHREHLEQHNGGKPCPPKSGGANGNSLGSR